MLHHRHRQPFSDRQSPDFLPLKRPTTLVQHVSTIRFNHKYSKPEVERMKCRYDRHSLLVDEVYALLSRALQSSWTPLGAFRDISGDKASSVSAGSSGRHPVGLVQNPDHRLFGGSGHRHEMGAGYDFRRRRRCQIETLAKIAAEIEQSIEYIRRLDACIGRTRADALGQADNARHDRVVAAAVRSGKCSVTENTAETFVSSVSGGASN